MALGVRVSEFSIPSIDRRKLFGGMLAAVAALGVLQVTQPEDRVPVLVAGSALEAGQPLGELDVSVRHVVSADGLVVGDSVGDLEGWSLRVPLAEGEPLIASLMQPPELVTSPNVIALSLAAENAVLGRLVAGDKVDVYVTSAADFDSEQKTERIARSVYIVEAVVSESSVDRGRVNVLLAVDDELAGKLAAASHESDIDLVRVAP